MMTTKTKKTATVATVALSLMAVLLAYTAFIAPVSAQVAAASTTTSTSTSATTSTTNQPPGQGPPGGFQGPQGGFQGHRGQSGPFQGAPGQRGAGGLEQANLTVGQTITVTSSSGNYFVVGDRSENGTASGTVTFTVTGKLAAGYTLSITSGSLVVSGTTYTISSGSAQMGRGAQVLTGQGATTPTGEFLVRASAHGTFGGTTATLSFDLSTGSTEYIVSLAGSVTG